MGNILEFGKKVNMNMKSIDEWTWSDFRDVHNVISKSQGEDGAWQMIYQLWQVRAGENHDA